MCTECGTSEVLLLVVLALVYLGISIICIIVSVSFLVCLFIFDMFSVSR